MGFLLIFFFVFIAIDDGVVGIVSAVDCVDDAVGIESAADCGGSVVSVDIVVGCNKGINCDTASGAKPPLLDKMLLLPVPIWF